MSSKLVTIAVPVQVSVYKDGLRCSPACHYMHKKRFCRLFEAPLNRAPDDGGCEMRLRSSECLAAEKGASNG